MLLLTATTDKLQVITGQAVAVDVHASWVDYASGTVTPGRTNTAISTATTTDIVAAPAASTQRNAKTLNLRNKDASASVDVTVQYNQNGTLYELIKITLAAGDTLEYVEGVGFFKVPNPVNLNPINQSTSDQTGFASDTYLSGSFITFPAGTPRVGTAYKLRFDMSKTAAGTAAPVLTLRTGTAGTTSDTSRLTFTWSAGTAATDQATFDLLCYFRTVGSGTSAVLVGHIGLVSQPTTGVSSLLHGLNPAASGGFDSTVASLGIGASFNGGASFSGTNRIVRAELIG